MQKQKLTFIESSVYFISFKLSVQQNKAYRVNSWPSGSQQKFDITLGKGTFSISYLYLHIYVQNQSKMYMPWMLYEADK